MSHFASYIEGVVSGVFLGWFSLIGLYLYLTIYVLEKNKAFIGLKTKEDEENEKHVILDREGDITEEELKVLKSAVAYLTNLDSTYGVISQNPDTFGYPGTPGSNNDGKVLASKYTVTDYEEMEGDFNMAMRELKEKIRNCRALTTFTNDLGKLYSSFSKDIYKLSVVANNNTIQGSINLAQASLFGSSEIDNDEMTDKFWATLAKALDMTSSEYDSLADKLSNNVAEKLGTLCEDLMGAEKHLSNEGTRRLLVVREATINRDKHLKDRDRRKEKVHANDKNASLMSGLGIQKDIGEKLQNSEQALSEANVRLSSLTKELNKSLPKIIQDCLTFSARSIITVRGSMNSIATSMKTINTRTVALMEDFTRSIDTATNSIIQSRLTESPDIGQQSPNSQLVNASKRISDVRYLIYGIVGRLVESDNKKASIAAAGDNQPSTTTTASKLNMSLESTCSLAAAPPLKFLSQLPPIFAKTIEHETSVWFNAFSGRVYRDIARSEYFHQWFCSKLAYLLNKGNRPGFIDEFKVDHVVFGSTPPILRNILWTPLLDPKRNEEGAKRRNSSSESQKSKSKKDISALGPLDDPDNDVTCQAEMSFKSSVQFSMSTKFWVNFPRDHYASIPITMKLDITEVSGPILFGVRRNCSFLSFLEEPQTRFKVHVEVGNQIKFKDIPLVSDYVETKIRKLIRKRFVYPNAYKGRLLWPRSWWPAGTENEFMPGSANNEARENNDIGNSNQQSTKDSTTVPTPADNDKESLSKRSSKAALHWLNKTMDGKGKDGTTTEDTYRNAQSTTPTVDVASEEKRDDDSADMINASRSNSTKANEFLDVNVDYGSVAETGTIPSARRNSADFIDDESEASTMTANNKISVLSASKIDGSTPIREGIVVGYPVASPTGPQASNPRTTSQMASNSANSNTSSASSSTSSAWLNNLHMVAQKTKTKLSEFKEKHLKGGNDDSSPIADSAISPSSTMNRNQGKDEFSMVNPRHRSSSADDDLRDSTDVPSNVTDGVDDNYFSNGSTQSNDRSANQGSATSTQHLQSITRRLQQAKQAFKNEVQKHVDPVRRGAQQTPSQSTNTSIRNSTPLTSFASRPGSLTTVSSPKSDSPARGAVTDSDNGDKDYIQQSELKEDNEDIAMDRIEKPSKSIDVVQAKRKSSDHTLLQQLVLPP